MRKFKIKIRGDTPYIMNRFCPEEIENDVRIRSGGQKKSEVLYDKKFYKNSKGKPYIPSSQIYAALINAGKDMLIVGKGKKNYSTLFSSVFDIKPEEIILKTKPKPFKVSGINPNTRMRVMIVRPRWDKWDLEFELACDDDQVPESVIRETIIRAGKYVGIGDWRPAKRGKYGKFSLVEFKKTK